MRWFFQASVSDFLNPRLCRLLLCILPIPSRFPNPRHSHYKGSSAHLGVPCLLPSISNCHTRSFSHLDVDRLRPSIPITHPDFIFLLVAVLLHAHIPTAPPPPLGSCESSRVDQSCFSVASCRHHTLLLRPPSFIPCLPFTYLK